MPEILQEPRSAGSVITRGLDGRSSRRAHLRRKICLDRREQDDERRSYVYSDRLKHQKRKASKGRGGLWYITTREIPSEERAKR
jgi:hypothetical protein